MVTQHCNKHCHYKMFSYYIKIIVYSIKHMHPQFCIYPANQPTIHPIKVLNAIKATNKSSCKILDWHSIKIFNGTVNFHNCIRFHFPFFFFCLARNQETQIHNSCHSNGNRYSINSTRLLLIVTKPKIFDNEQKGIQPYNLPIIFVIINFNITTTNLYISTRAQQLHAHRITWMKNVQYATECTFLLLISQFFYFFPSLLSRDINNPFFDILLWILSIDFYCCMSVALGFYSCVFFWFYRLLVIFPNKNDWSFYKLISG